MHRVHIPRLVVGAPHGRSGKTTATMGLLAALVSRGMVVQPFKKGPDFIDPSWLTRVTGRLCRNLDSFLMDRSTIRKSLAINASGADICVVEGAMGLYDGVDMEGSGSTAEVAKAIQAPVLLVLDTTRMTRSSAAIVMGFQHFDPGVHIAGVILNKVARPRHERMLRGAIESFCGIPVLGVIPRGRQFTIPDRHLGLIPAGERDELSRSVEEIGKVAREHLDLDKIIDAAGAALPLEFEAPLPWEQQELPVRDGGDRPVIGIIKDRAFTFYYPENLEALVSAGADLLEIDAMHDPLLPEVDALYIGGGFPEVFGAELERNAGLRSSLRRRIEEGLPVYAECGGLMYLGRRLTWKDKTYEMTGALPFDVIMTDKPQGHGYEVVEVTGPNEFFAPGATVRGHEFHHSKVVNLDDRQIQYAFRVTRGSGIDGERDGLVYKNVLAAYNHIHALSERDWAGNMVKRARAFRSNQGK